MSNNNERGEIQVGSIGTIYRVPTWDDDLTPANFDPSLASVKKIIFSMPQANGSTVRIERTATASQVDIDGMLTWCLIYVVVAADAPTFHIAAGPLKFQGYVEYSADQKWHSAKITRDYRGRPLQVYANL